MNTRMKFGLKDKKRIFAVFAAVIIMGFSLSFLIRVNFGADPCTYMNLGISDKLGISFGTWQLLLNAILFIFVILFDRSQIGWGTLANMVLLGYTVDFFRWCFDFIIPSHTFSSLIVRIVVLVPSLILFILAAAVYMSVELGSVPYDATVFIIASKLKRIPFRVIRMTWDISACIIGLLLGGAIGIVTVIMAFSLGSVISWVKSKVNRFFTV